ncbi:hypothetical protein K7X08_004578 [Anisodus acutangulus]|uniref:Uncharacterized protein n=1 Tax=Anisodus acutangulus TaxID=402998 RepID=A0A9Q1MDN5_9SOLA|nr:hypothetical protein K7X08_004578 [Anisodus acutangulus]
MEVVTDNYSIGKKIQGNIYEGKLKRHNKLIEVSIRVCSSVETAYRYFNDLQKFNGSPNVATAYSFCETEDGKGLTFTEPLKKMDWWLNDKGKKMWSRNHKGDKILGFGQEAQDFFYQIGLGMEAINLVGVVHGNLVEYNQKGDVIGTEGVMLGSDGNPRVCKFQYDESSDETGVRAPKRLKVDEHPEMIRRLQKDLDDFGSLILLARMKHPPSLPFAGDLSNEYVLFLDLFTAYDRDGHAEPRKFVEDVSVDLPC